MIQKKKIYFASDFHLGYDGAFSSKEREIKLVSWLNNIEGSAAEIYLLGDVFDYWFEYKEVIPQGFNLLLGKLKELRLKGIPIYFFTGNHDMWVFNYFQDELDIKTYRKPLVKEILGKKFYLAHGDGLGNIPFLDNLMKYTFSNKLLQWLFARIHPNTGIRIMKYFSNLSRNSHSEYDKKFNVEKEFLVNYSIEYLKTDNTIDFFVFGHRHIPIQIDLPNSKTKFINLGDWIYNFSYGVFDGETFKLEFYEPKG